MEQTQTKISSRNEPCIDNPRYDYYKCVESYFYGKRGCQYPWNTYKDLDIPICQNLTQTEYMILNKDRSLGKDRIYFDHSETLARTNMTCPRPCQFTTYRLGFGSWNLGKVNGIKENSIQIGFPNFRIENIKEYPVCDLTCVIGQLGGNLGFFLGGSILAGLDLFVNVLSKAVKVIARRLIQN